MQIILKARMHNHLIICKGTSKRHEFRQLCNCNETYDLFASWLQETWILFLRNPSILVHSIYWFACLFYLINFTIPICNNSLIFSYFLVSVVKNGCFFCLYLLILYSKIHYSTSTHTLFKIVEKRQTRSFFVSLKWIHQEKIRQLPVFGNWNRRYAIVVFL